MTRRTAGFRIRLEAAVVQGCAVAICTLWVCTLPVVAAGCDLPPEHGPPVGPRVVASDPFDGETNVDRSRSLRVMFDRAVLPRDVDRAHVGLESGVRNVFLELFFDPVERALHLHHDTPLDPSVLYRLEVHGLRDLAGRPMSEPFVAAFRTGRRAYGEPEPEPPRWSDVAPIFASCAEDACHGSNRPVLGLDLSSADGIRRTAVGVVAEQSRLGVQEGDPWQGAPTLAGLARVDVVGGVGRPSRSYLLYKVLGESAVWGDPMPPPPALPLDATQLRLLSDWIRAGAPTN